MFTITRSSIPKSLRWMRRIMTVVLIVSNFATVMLAGAAPAPRVPTQTLPSEAGRSE